LRYVREYYLLQDLSPWRRQYLAQILGQTPPAINTDLSPGCFFFDLILTASQEGLGIKELLLALQKLPPAVPWAALALGTLAAGGALRRRPGPRYLYQVMVMGLGSMALEILVLVLYQIRLGSLYQQLGMLVAAYMAGMAAGSAAGSRWAGRSRGGPGLLAAWQGGLAVLAAGLALGLPGSGNPGAPGSDFWVRGAYSLILGAAGFGGGGIFALSAAYWHELQPAAPGLGGRLYAADLLGATLGTLLISLVVLPVWGIVPALWLVAFLHTGAGVTALGGTQPP
jgi:spermidine synthase